MPFICKIYTYMHKNLQFAKVSSPHALREQRGLQKPPNIRESTWYQTLLTFCLHPPRVLSAGSTSWFYKWNEEWWTNIVMWFMFDMKLSYHKILKLTFHGVNSMLKWFIERYIPNRADIILLPKNSWHMPTLLITTNLWWVNLRLFSKKT